MFFQKTNSQKKSSYCGNRVKDSDRIYTQNHRKDDTSVEREREEPLRIGPEVDLRQVKGLTEYKDIGICRFVARGKEYNHVEIGNEASSDTGWQFLAYEIQGTCVLRVQPEESP